MKDASISNPRVLQGLAEGNMLRRNCGSESTEALALSRWALLGIHREKRYGGSNLR